MKTAEQYLARATFARELARSVRQAATKAYYLNIAAEMEKLARQEERGDRGERGKVEPNKTRA